MDDRHLKILRAGNAGALPRHIGEATKGFSLDAMRELRQAGLIESGFFQSTDGGPEFLDARITLSGREYLDRLEQAVPDEAAKPADSEPPRDREWHNQPLGKIALAVVGGILLLFVAYLITTYAGISLRP